MVQNYQYDAHVIAFRWYQRMWMERERTPDLSTATATAANVAQHK